MRDPKYVTTDQNRIRPRVNDMENGVFNIFVTTFVPSKVCTNEGNIYKTVPLFNRRVYMTNPSIFDMRR